jgi:hypothetical protein
MSSIKLRLFDADRVPLDDIVDVDVGSRRRR